LIEALNQRVEDVATLNSKLILLVGAPRSGKTELLKALAERRQLGVVSTPDQKYITRAA